MPKLGLLGVVLALGCSSGSDQGSGAVDPASLDFCLQWANGVCRLAYLCVDPSAQDSAFQARYGKSKDDCWQSVEKYCSSNQSGSQTFGPSCGAGKKVNADLASACTDSLELETCAVWMAAPAGACDAVCSSTSIPSGGGGGAGAGGTGAGGTSAGGTGAGGSNTSTGSVATPKDFCLTETSVQCERIFECKPTQAAQMGTLADCKAETATLCVGEVCPNAYDATKAASCVAAVKTATCEQLNGGLPADCLAACP